MVLPGPPPTMGSATRFESPRERTRQGQRGRRWPTSHFRHARGGPRPTVACSLLGPWGKRRCQRKLDLGGDAGPLSEARSGLSAAPHTCQLPTLLPFSSLARRRQAPERPCPQSPCGHCGPERGPQHSRPLHFHRAGPDGPQHPTAHRWVLRDSPAALLFPTSHLVPSPVCDVCCCRVSAVGLGS